MKDKLFTWKSEHKVKPNAKQIDEAAENVIKAYREWILAGANYNKVIHGFGGNLEQYDYIIKFKSGSRKNKGAKKRKK